MKNHLRLIAIKPNEACSNRYRKILHNQFYLFYDDYEIIEDRLEKKKGDALGCSEVPMDFYKTDNNVKLSVSAIIGKNGDGKSTIVELIMRILNNFAYAVGFIDNQETLKPIKDLHAELYYEIDGALHSVISEGNDITWKLPHEEYIHLELHNIEENKKKITKEKLEQHFFYTQVSNYSLYAYNSIEFEGESDEGDWIDGVVHKNDGYQTPIVLNPKRTEGNIDINTENDLTRQRLTSLLITDLTKDSFRWINEKQVAQAFSVKLFKESKLEKVALLDFFKNYSNKWRKDYFTPEKGENISIDIYINDIMRAVNMLLDQHDLKCKIDITDQLTQFVTLLNILFDITCQIDRDTFHIYLAKSKRLYNEIENIHATIKIYLGNIEKYMGLGNINQSIISKTKLKNKIDQVALYFQPEPININELDIDDREVSGYFNFIYLQRIITISLIEQIWNEKISNMGHNVQENIKDKIKQYIIYKTITIISRYPNYKEFSKPTFTAIDFTKDAFFIQNLKDCLRKAIHKIWDDINGEKSHITLKIRQCMNFLHDHPYGSQPYNDNDTKFINITNFYQKITTYIDEQKENLYEYFFPAIFESDILLYQMAENETPTVNQKDLFSDYNLEEDKKLTMLSQLSSGERQQINAVSTIIYHLRNIDSVSDEEELLVKYRYVNLIFEEMELYFHPEFQRIFIDFLRNHISKAKLKLDSINLCFVTHSPFILSDIPQQNILVLQKGEPKKDKPFDTLGANIHEMLGHNFMLDYTIGEVVRKKINDFLKEYTEFTKLKKEGKEYKMPEGYHFRFLINNMGNGYLKNLLNGYYNEMMRSNKETFKELIQQKQEELKKLEDDFKNKKNVKGRDL